LCRIIRDDDLHVLIYPEIGMDPATLRLAALRLAPVQCASWGHPDTSGLPTIDYYLSSDLMENSDADDHYTERLIRLPNLSVNYKPLEISAATITRETLGLNPQSILYLCCQSLFKYLPQYDEIYPRIAHQVNGSKFLFISEQSHLITEQFRDRLERAFHRINARLDDFVTFLPRVNAEEYNAINCLSDIYLDSIGWSGCNSTFEALSCNLPVVTLKGNLMRGRHSSAILTLMGLADTIAATKDEYVDLAVKLGNDPSWRNQISQIIAAQKHRLYNDEACIRGLEDFLEKAVKEKT
jgi:protein O-GlcNAc transferase